MIEMVAGYGAKDQSCILLKIVLNHQCLKGVEDIIVGHLIL